MTDLRPHAKFEGISFIQKEEKKLIYTLNLDEGKTVYGETLLNFKGKEYREWNPYRSKLAAAISKNIRNIYLTKNTRCLYLGASSGTTVSHISDILTNGVIFAVEFAPRSIRELVQNCQSRKNVIPILADANYPNHYAKYLFGEIDLVYEDIAQPNQTEIGIINCQKFLKNGGIFIIAIKARSIDVISQPKDIFDQECLKLEEQGFEILEKINIAPYSQDHMLVVSRYFEK
jgi:fibrillarin-like pre-rRNA processing protein